METSPLLTVTPDDLKIALYAKNYEVVSVMAESYSKIGLLVRDTNVYEDKNVSVNQIDSEAHGTTRIGSRIQRSHNTVPIQTNGSHTGDPGRAYDYRGRWRLDNDHALLTRVYRVLDFTARLISRIPAI